MNYRTTTQERQQSQTSTPLTSGVLQRKCACGTHSTAGGECGSCQKKKTEGNLQRFAKNRDSLNEAPPIVGEVLQSSGEALDTKTRRFFESRFAHDFSQVRVHKNAKAAESAQLINALAYTVGNNVVFGAGGYEPDSANGKSLLAHELSHVMQQGNRANSSLQPLRIGAEESPAEKQADAMAKAAAGWQAIPENANFDKQVMRATRTFFLTFDDGPHAAALGKGSNRTEKVLDTLKKESIGAGFFVQTGVSYRGDSTVGRQLIQRMHKEGHKVGIHTGGTADHELHTKAEKAGRLTGELEAAKKYIKTETGEDAKLVRPPTGAFNKAVEATYKKVSLTNFLWDMDGDQGADLSLKVLKDRVKSEMLKVQAKGWKPSTPSSAIVVLYHDIQKGTANNLAALIAQIKKVTSDISGGKDTAAFTAPVPSAAPSTPTTTPTATPTAPKNDTEKE
jgi:peptidoglycan/xylan/chitin deacetylase (PgdA/CDA1 family)